MSFKPRMRAGVTTAISVLALAFAWVAAIMPGLQGVKGGAKAAWIAAGLVATLLGLFLPAREQFKRISKMENAEVEALVGLNDALDPIVAQLGRIAAATTEESRRPLAQQIIPMVLSSAAQLAGLDRVRACWFQYEDSPKECLRPVMAHGRSGTPTRCFDADTDVGREVLKSLRENKPQFFPDLGKKVPTGWQAQSDLPKVYQGFLSVPVVAGTIAFGLLTVDSLESDSLGEEDVSFVKILAGLLAASLARS